MKKDENRRCPECGYPDIYTGVLEIECGYIETCSNWTKTQSKEVDKLKAVRNPNRKKRYSEESDDCDSYFGPFQFSLDYEDDGDTLPWPIPDFGVD